MPIFKIARYAEIILGYMFCSGGCYVKKRLCVFIDIIPGSTGKFFTGENDCD